MINVGMTLTEIGHAKQFALLFDTRSTIVKSIHIAFVHSNNHIKIKKVLIDNRTGQMGQFISPPGSMHAHPGIRKFSLMIIADTGRIEEKLRFQTSLTNHMTHHFFGSRRATDIAQTNEQDLFHITLH